MNKQRHHKYPQHKRHRKKYGKLIDSEKNIQIIDADSHMEGKGDRWNEMTFTLELGIRKCEWCRYEFHICNNVPPEECKVYNFDREKYEKANA